MLDKYMKQVLKEIFMTKKMYIGKLGDQVNQRSASFVMNEQFPIWDKNNFYI